VVFLCPVTKLCPYGDKSIFYVDPFSEKIDLCSKLALRRILRLIKLKDVMQKTSLARSTIYKYISFSEFPKPIKLGCKSVAWLESEIDDWIKAKIDESRN